jgi:L-alanine-DL-glutamate epimerase-like enolase superfamily enzyme
MMVRDLEAKRMFVEKYAFTEPERYWHYLHHLFPKNNFLVCALDMAAWDLYGKMKNMPLYKLWGYDMAKAPMTDYTIGIDSIEKMLEKVDAKPWPIYKVKLGTEEDIEIIRAIKSRTNAKIRVDANAGWTTDEGLKLIKILRDLDVELIEQPIHKDSWDDMKKLYAQSTLPLFADEACVAETDVARCQGHFHGINIKLTKCGGITPARRMIVTARELGLQIMIGSMNETSIGTAAMVHLLPAVDHADADGPLLLAKDLATGLTFSAGRISVTDDPGLGIAPHLEAL